jgi:hypothetical protein
MDTIPYAIAPSKYNLGVFLLSFNNRRDGRTMKEAFQHDFGCAVPDHVVTYEELIHYIMSLR